MIKKQKKETAALCLKFPKVPTFIKPKVSRTVTENLSFIQSIHTCPVDFTNLNSSCLSARNLIFNLVPRNFRALLLHKLDKLLRALHFLFFLFGAIVESADRITKELCTSSSLTPPAFTPSCFHAPFLFRLRWRIEWLKTVYQVDETGDCREFRFRLEFNWFWKQWKWGEVEQQRAYLSSRHALFNWKYKIFWLLT